MTRILVFGDSIVSDEYYLGFDCWVTRLREFLGKQGENLVYNLGICGDTSKGLLMRIDVECKARIPEIIIIDIGANDSRFNNITGDSVETPIDEFKKNIKEIIKICKKYTNKIIFIGNLPADESKTTPTIWSDVEYFTNKSMKKYDNAVKSVCKENNIDFIEIFDEFIDTDYKKLLDEEDGLHPNSKGHEKLFKRVKDLLVEKKLI